MASDGHARPPTCEYCTRFDSLLNLGTVHLGPRALLPFPSSFVTVLPSPPVANAAVVPEPFEPELPLDGFEPELPLEPDAALPEVALCWFGLMTTKYTGRTTARTMIAMPPAVSSQKRGRLYTGRAGTSRASSL